MKFPQVEISCEGTGAMNKIDTSVQRKEEELLNFDFSDEAIEAAAGEDALAGYTQYGCTYGYCPSY